MPSLQSLFGFERFDWFLLSAKQTTGSKNHVPMAFCAFRLDIETVRNSDSGHFSFKTGVFEEIVFLGNVQIQDLPGIEVVAFWDATRFF